MKYQIAEGRDPKRPEIGPVLLEGGFPKMALPYLEQAVKDRPKNGADLCNLGICLRNLKDLGSALTCLRKAAELSPRNSAVWHNLGLVLENLGMFGEAEASYQNAHKLFPDWVGPRMGIAYCQVRRGAFLECIEHWELHRHWTACPDSPPVWKGENLSGKRIVVWPEGGAGDHFMFLRYLLELKRRGAAVTLVSFVSLKGLLAAQPCVDHWINAGDVIETDEYDYQISLWSIPAVLKKLPLPMAAPYIRQPFAFECRTSQCTVGICVQAGEKFERATQGECRSVPPELLRYLPHLGTPLSRVAHGADQEIGVPRYIGLQLEPLPDWIENHNTECRQGWEFTARLVQGCDLVISCDTAVAHLAGAMGVPVWLILPLNSGWQYGLEKNTCEWYPSMRLFRNKEPYDFTKPMRQVAEELRLGTPLSRVAHRVPARRDDPREKNLEPMGASL